MFSIAVISVIPTTTASLHTTSTAGLFMAPLSLNLTTALHSHFPCEESELSEVVSNPAKLYHFHQSVQVGKPENKYSLTIKIMIFLPCLYCSSLYMKHKPNIFNVTAF